MRTLHTSVRRLVEFLLRSGDMDSGRGWRGGIEAMQAGSDIHRMLQAAGGEAYQAEVPLAGSVFFPNGTFNPHAARLDIREETVRDQPGFFLCVEGRADGIIDDGTHPLVIDEIKGVSRDVSAIREPAAVHEAQALCYAYLYLRSSRGPATLYSSFGEKVVVRLTYASMTTGEVRQIERTYDVPGIEDKFFLLLSAAARWAAWRVSHDDKRDGTLASLRFPFAPRDAQRQIMDAVSRTIREGRRLYAQAPTGSGKTLATLYPALKAMGSGQASRIVYLTAKTMTRRTALESLDLLKQQGINTNVLVVTARDKLCPLRSNPRSPSMRARPLASLCNPLECPLARGHYDTVNDALYEAITGYDVLDFDRIQEVAARHHVCPYELQRDATRWSDIIVCDYHHAFAPGAGLFGLAYEPGSGDTVLLVDEAHNLVERMRDMYSAELSTTDLRELERLVRAEPSLGQLAQAVRAVASAFPVWDKTLPAGTRAGSGRQAKQPSYQVVRIGDAFGDALVALASGIDAALEQLFSVVDDAGGRVPQAEMPRDTNIEALLTLRDVGYKVRALDAALQRSEVGYVKFLSRASDGGGTLKIFCVDPSHDLDERLKQAKATVFFSGTLLPLDYHRRLLAAQDDDASVYVESSFDHRHLQVLIGSDVSARYSKRGPKLYARIAAYLVALTRTRPGNYLAFVPSYAMLDEVRQTFEPLANNVVTVVSQRPGMREDEREHFVARFREARMAGTSLVGLCVLGGIFGESIDLPGDSLVGVVVVGTGMPRTSDEREVIRSYFDAKDGKGFAYAYTYPGLIKVLQAAGRLIRTENDRGVVLLLDDRFLERELRDTFPKEWKNVRACTLETLATLPGER